MNGGMFVIMAATALRSMLMMMMLMVAMIMGMIMFFPT
jgi:hypothetical protein